MLEVLQGLDGGVLIWIQDAVRQEWLNPLVACYTHLGDAGMMWIAFCVVFLLFKPTRKAGAAGKILPRPFGGEPDYRLIGIYSYIKG